MSFQYTGHYMVPGQTAELSTFENTFWVDRFERHIWESVLLSGASRDTGNTNNTGILRPGLLLGKVTATNKLKEWNPTGTDGSEIVFGILSINQVAQRLGADQDRWFGQVMVGGMVRADRLIVPGESSMGLDESDYEHIIRAQMFGRFIFNDQYRGNNFGGWQDVVAKTANYTVLEGDNNKLFTTRGAAGAVNFTLPATAKKGLRYGFYCAADQDMTVTAGTADTMVAINDLAADSVAFSTASLKIGGMIEVYGDGTGWLTRVSAGQTSNGTTSGQLVTVVTA